MAKTSSTTKKTTTDKSKSAKSTKTVKKTTSKLPEIKVSTKKKIVFLGSEAAPFIATGGLADVLGSLPKALAKNKNLDVSVILPLYSSINAEFIYSTFDERAKNHVRISELAIEKAKRMVEQGKHVVVLMDSITKLVRAYNETVISSGKILSGGIDPIALQEGKKIFGSARNTTEAGSLTIIATVLTETGSKMEDVIYEEFKGTGNSEIVLLKSLSERRIFPAIDLYRSGTRKDELLLTEKALDCSYYVRRNLDLDKEAEVKLIELLKQTKNNDEFIEKVAVLSK